METKKILLKDKIDNGILRLTLNNPKNQNTLSELMMDSLKKAFSDAATDQSIRVIILAANGAIFCAGHDLKEITDEENLKILEQIILNNYLILALS